MKVFSCGVIVERGLYGVAVLTLYGTETWSMAVAEKKQLNIMDMRCLRSMCGIMLIDRVRNEM